jgi:hypothetical protein
MWGEMLCSDKMEDRLDPCMGPRPRFPDRVWASGFSDFDGEAGAAVAGGEGSWV